MAAPLKIFTIESLTVRLYGSPLDLAQDAAREVQAHLQEVLAAQGSARTILATGNSQLQFLDELFRLGEVDWSKITLFHMDEYLGISADDSASFRHYMRERVENKIKPKQFHYIEGNALEPIKECERYGRLLQEQPIDLCCFGIGENGHLAFNDPPVANFADVHPVKIVKLDEVCKMQQVKQGHFPNLASVPPYALTLTIPALCSVKKMVGLCPGKNKAQPIRDALRGPVSPACPASILRRQPHAVLLLDTESASLL